MKIYTKTGDGGETSLFGGGRVSKSSLRVAAYGDVDELNAVLGWVLATEPTDFERDLLLAIQRDLFALGARLASPKPEKVATALAKAPVPADRVADLEAAIDRLDRGLAPLTTFILPGGTPKAAALHVARTVCRRAERGVVALGQTAELPPGAVPYLNRLSDLLFVLARSADHAAGVEAEPW